MSGMPQRSHSSEELLLEEHDQLDSLQRPEISSDSENEEWGRIGVHRSQDHYSNWLSRLFSRVAHRYPVLHLKTRRLCDVLRGPVPPTGLPGQ